MHTAMDSVLVIVLGYISGVLTTFAGVPQVIKLFKSKSTQDLSYISLSMTVSGLCTWTVYGFLRRDSPMIIFNLLAFVIYGGMLSLKIYIEKFSKERPEVKYNQIGMDTNIEFVEV
jgi:MtN3 and saliva related transmembrane protein